MREGRLRQVAFLPISCVSPVILFEEKHFDDGAVAVGSKHLFSSLAGYFMISSHMIIIYLKPDTNRTGFFRLFCNFS